MDERLWMFRATLVIVFLGVLNIFDLLQPVWLLAATIFGGLLLFYEKYSTNIRRMLPMLNERLLILFVLIIFFGVFGYLEINTGINAALEDDEYWFGRINDTLSLILLGVSIGFYINR